MGGKGRGRVLGLFGDELVTEHNFCDIPGTIAILGTTGALQWTSIDLYDLDPSEIVQTGRMPYLRGIRFDFVPAVTFVAGLKNALGDNGQINYLTTITVMDDKGKQALDQPATPGDNSTMIADWFAAGLIGSSGPISYTKGGIGDRENPLYNRPLTSALSIVIQSLSYPAVDAEWAGTSQGLWNGQLIVGWKAGVGVQRASQEALMRDAK